MIVASTSPKKLTLKDSPQNQFDVIIAGGGLAGLTAAILLARANKKSARN
jgi:ribulose 1,5-bisphosphate synthetase/thiazole synthase